LEDLTKTELLIDYCKIEEQLFNAVFNGPIVSVLNHQEQRYFSITYAKPEANGLDELDMLHIASRYGLKVNFHI
jgi:hypothetical protein